MNLADALQSKKFKDGERVIQQVIDKDHKLQLYRRYQPVESKEKLLARCGFLPIHDFTFAFHVFGTRHFPISFSDLHVWCILPCM